jgi:EAL domain-containing protein (putative c-di-GMP-specific phosphodiesterase class I)
VDDGWIIRDLSSTNGTFVNSQRVVEQPLADGDIVHVAGIEFCFRDGRTAGPPEPRDRAEMTQQVWMTSPPPSAIRSRQFLQELIAKEAVRIVFEPIVDLRTRTVVAYEALSRGTHPGLSQSPAALLELAEGYDMAVELSDFFRRMALRASTRLPADAKLFLNVHAGELASPAFSRMLESMRSGRESGDRKIVLEIAESSVTDVEAMTKHRGTFRSLGLEFAFDDFGAGQNRWVELTDAPPDYLKLDRALIQELDKFQPRQGLIEALVKVARAVDVQIIAEGIETEEIAAVCRDLGCDLGQGYFFGPAL